MCPLAGSRDEGTPQGRAVRIRRSFRPALPSHSTDPGESETMAIFPMRIELAGSFATQAEAEARARELGQDEAAGGSATVVARGLKVVDAAELAPAALTVAQGAASSAIGAAVVVGLFGALDPTISLIGVLALAFYALIFGAVGGALIGALFYGLATRHPRITHTPQAFAAERFDVLFERTQVSDRGDEQC
jgi:hypothetical protein